MATLRYEAYEEVREVATKLLYTDKHDPAFVIGWLESNISEALILVREIKGNDRLRLRIEKALLSK